MLTTHSNETSILERIKSARGNAEPQEPTEEPQIVEMSEEDNPIEDEHEEVLESNDEEVEEYESEIEEPASEDDDFYIDLDGEEVSLSEVKKWKSGNMMQADYTRKTTELAEQRKQFDEEREVYKTNQAKLNETIAELTAVIETEQLSSEQLQELREYEPERYIEYQEKQSKRKEALEKAKGLQVNDSPMDAQAELTKLVSNNPHWLENGKPTEAYQKDQALLNDYAQKVGLTTDQFSRFDATMMQMAIDAAKYKEGSKKDAAIAKKVRKAPVMTKPRQAATKGIQDQIRAAEAKLKKTGRMEDAVALRKLKAKLNN